MAFFTTCVYTTTLVSNIVCEYIAVSSANDKPDVNADSAAAVPIRIIIDGA